MEWLIVSFAWLVAYTFAVAALTKAVQFDDFVNTLAALLPASSAGAVPILAGTVIAAEVGVSCLIVVDTAIGALSAIALLLGFSLVAEYSIRSGRVVSCSCFGPFSRDQLGRRTQLRNIGLAAVAAFVLAAPPSVPPVGEGWLALSTAAFLVAGVVAVWAGRLAQDLSKMIERKVI